MVNNGMAKLYYIVISIIIQYSSLIHYAEL